MKLLSRIFNIFAMAALLAAASLSIKPVPSAHAAGGTNITITIFTDNTIPDTFCTLREAITNANNDAATYPDCPAGSGNDTITLANDPEQTITLGAPLQNITDVDGLTIVGPNRFGIISGNNAFRIFSVISAPLTLKFMILKEASAIQGGAIYSTGKLTIINSIFEENQSTQAGSSIYSNGALTIINSTFSDNQPGFGTILNAANGTITNSTFYNNSSVGPGGAVFNQGKLTIKNSTFSNNSAGTLGANIYQSGSSASLKLYNNILANSTGGGDCVSESGTVSGTNNLFEDGSTTCGLGNDHGNILGVDPILQQVTREFPVFPINFDSPAVNAGSNTQCPTTDQRGITRPQGGQCDIGSFEYQPVTTLTLTSSAINDGWILESKESSGKGLTMNSAAATFNLGDDPADRQYRAILHFDTSSLPDNAVIVSATLKIKKKSLAGTDPFNILGNLYVSIRKPAFGTTALAATDFKSAAGKNNVASFGGIPIGAWYAASINEIGWLYINRSGSTQFRLSFAIDDNDNNSNDHMKFYSGNAGAANRPQLIIEYTIP